MAAPQINIETYSSREYTVSLTLPNISYGVWTITGPQSTVTGSGSHSIQFVGTRAQVNADLVAVDYIPAPDFTTSPFNVTYLQSDDNDNGTPGSNVVNGTMEMTIGTTHNEANIAAQTYTVNTLQNWNLGSITDLRPDNIDSNITYKMSLRIYDQAAGFPLGWAMQPTQPYGPGVYENMDEVNMSKNGMPIIVSVPTTDQVDPFTPYAYIAYTSSNETIEPVSGTIVNGVAISDDAGRCCVSSTKPEIYTIPSPALEQTINITNSYRVSLNELGNDLLVCTTSGAVNIYTRTDTNTVLTGSIDTTASTAVVGSATLFTTELEVGQSIIVSGETRVIDTITDNTHLTVTVAFSDNANDTSPEIVAPYWSHQEQVTTGLGSTVYGNISSDGNKILVGSTTTPAKIYSRTGGVWSLDGTLSTGSSGCLSPDGTKAAIGQPAGVSGGTVRLYETVTFTEILFETNNIRTDFGKTVSLSDNGTRLLIGTNGNYTELYFITGSTSYLAYATNGNFTIAGIGEDISTDGLYYSIVKDGSFVTVNHDAGNYDYTENTKPICNNELASVNFQMFDGYNQTTFNIGYSQLQVTDGLTQVNQDLITVTKV